jgi:hypothetical protein
MSNLLYQPYYRQHGARYPDNLSRIAPFQFDQLTRESIYHVYDDGDGVPELDTEKPYFKNQARKVLVEHVYHYHRPEGLFRQLNFSLAMSVQPWKRKHLQTFQIEDDLTKVRPAPDQLMVVNYGYLDRCYSYQPVVLSSYYKWKNRVETIFTEMDRLASATGRQQFMILKIPAQLQGRTILDKYAAAPVTPAFVTLFGSSDGAGFLQLDLWRWLTVEHRARSLLSAIDPKNYSKVNFIFEGVTGKQCLVNLGYLNSWIDGQPNQTEFTSVVQYNALTIQKLFLKMCLTLNEIEAVEADEAVLAVQVEQKKAEPPAATSDEELAETATSDTGVDSESVVVSVGKSPTNGDVSAAALADNEKKEKRLGIKEMDDLLSAIENDLIALDRISLTQAKNKGVSKVAEEVRPEVIQQEIPEPVVSQEKAIAKVFEKKSSEELLSARLASDAEAGLISAAEYRRMSEAMKQFAESADPYGSGQPRKVASSIKDEDVVLSEEGKEIVVGDAVPDRSMTKSSLNHYNKQYIRNVAKKDILNVVDRIQAAGVVVKSHEVERRTTILGTQEHHRLELKPVDGQSSTISFTLPVVEEDGTFYSAGSKYRSRIQRVDVPIRKIAPSIVSLSTYYGKTFIQINPKVVNNSVTWIVKKINQAIITEGSYITDINLGNVFDNEFAAPFIYNAIASEFESFKAGKTELFFNHRVRGKMIDPELLKRIEKNSRVFCGWTAKKNPVIVDRTNHFYEIDGETEHSLGDIYRLLQLEKDSAPVDFSEVRVFSKYIPVGVVLGYYVGFKNLIAALGAEYRIAEPRKNKMLKDNEYALSFKDVTYVFSRDKRFESLILAGFGDFEKTIKQYESHLFDQKDVYFNLFMSKGIGALYTRELDMMEHAFVDHISEEILVKMKEPTTFKGLLYRGTELLQTYHHPVSQDRSVMRDRGYERFAGAAYKEIMLAIRQFRNKNLIGRSKIDISPYQVLNTVMKDSANKTVEDINPIQNLKEAEVITFSGMGGRDKDTMTKPSRAFHINDVGVLSESTVDNAGVGTVAYLSANPNISDVRGLMSEKKELSPTNMMSTASLVSPCSFKDN